MTSWQQARRLQPKSPGVLWVNITAKHSTSFLRENKERTWFRCYDFALIRKASPTWDRSTDPLAHCLHQSSERLQEVQSPAWLPLSHCSELNCPWYLPWWWKCSRSMLTNGHMWQASSHPKLSGSEHPTPPCNNGLSPPHHWGLQEGPGYNCFPSTPFPLRNTLLWMSSYMISLNLTNSGVIPSQVINFLCSTASPNIIDFRFFLELPRAD